MIAGKIKGRLGNQLFRIAAVSSLAKDHDSACVFTRGTESCTMPSEEEQREWYETILRRVSYTSDFSFIDASFQAPSHEYNELPFLPNTIYDGNFQSFKYFEHNAEYIRQLFTLTEDHQDRLRASCPFLFAESSEHVSLHIRRGDYLKLDQHPVCSSDYYTAALSHFPSSLPAVVFSDDIEWCRDNLILHRKTFFIENPSGVDNIYLMSQCSHNIIANSSFSWWAAFLNQNNEKRIIAPRAWWANKASSTLYYPDWIIL